MDLLSAPWLSYHSYTNYHRWNILIFNNLVILNLDAHNGLILDMSNVLPFHSFYQKSLSAYVKQKRLSSSSSTLRGRTELLNNYNHSQPES